MQMKAIPQGAVIRGSRTNRLLLVLMRICIMVTGLMVFFPSLNPGRISMLINENVSLFTTAISYDTLTNLMEYALRRKMVTPGDFHLLMAGAAVVLLGILLCCAGACCPWRALW